MTHVITELCERKGDCVEACPVDCIMPGKKGDAAWPLFYIDPEVCIDCTNCVSACPIDGAIYADYELPPEAAHMTAVNAAFYAAGGGKWDFDKDRDLEEQRGQ